MSITLLNFERRYCATSTTILHKRKAVSPVIATVILIAVAVALGIAVAFWASGLTSSFSKYEKLGVSTQYATGTGGTWYIYLGGQNTGSSDATITQIQVNGVPYPLSGGNTANNNPEWNSTSGGNTIAGTSTSLSVPSGASFSIRFELTNSGSTSVPGKTFADGQTIQVTIITAAGNSYPASIVLP
jgi:flagellin-like protein